MKVIYAGEKFSKSKFSVFLAGPTPREVSVKSWRPEFIQQLKIKGFQGTVFSPENRLLGSPYDFDKQIPWEVKGLNKADLIIYWILRELKTMPAFTTNIEFGEFMHSGKIAVGFPPESVNNRYIGKRCQMHKIPLFSTTESIISYICEKELKLINQKLKVQECKKRNAQEFKKYLNKK